MLPSRRQAKLLVLAATVAVLFAKRRKILDRLDRILHTWNFVNESLLHGSRIGAIILEDINRFLLHPHSHEHEREPPSISGLPQSIRRVVALMSSAEVHAAIRNLASGLTQGVSDGIWSTGLEALNVPGPTAAAAAAAAGSAARGVCEALRSDIHHGGSWALFLAIASRALQSISHQLDVRAARPSDSSPLKPEAAAALRAAAASGESTAVLAAVLRASLAPHTPLRRCTASAAAAAPPATTAGPSSSAFRRPPFVPAAAESSASSPAVSPRIRPAAPAPAPSTPTDARRPPVTALRLRLTGARPASPPPRPAPPRPDTPGRGLSAGELAASHAADIVRATVCAFLGDTPEQRASALAGTAAATTSAAVRAAVEATGSVLAPSPQSHAWVSEAARAGVALVGETARCPDARRLVLDLTATVVRESVTAGIDALLGRHRRPEPSAAPTPPSPSLAWRIAAVPARLVASAVRPLLRPVERLRSSASEGRSRPCSSLLPARFVLFPLVPLL